MKQILSSLTIMLILIALNVQVIAQQDCSTAVDVSTLPYSATGLTTTGAVNDYSDTDACESASMNNEDYVFSITPTEDIQINVELINTEIISEGITYATNIGLFIIEGCPDATSTCVQSVDATANPSLTDVDLSSGITYYIIVSSENALLGDATNVDFDINITKNALDDVGVIAITEITSSCGMTSNSIECTIENFGLSAASGFTISYSINGETPVDETYSLTIDAETTATYTFPTPIDFSTVGDYSIQVYTSLIGDENSDNDESLTSVTHYPTISTFPAIEDFESDNGYWSTGGEATSWEYGDPDDLISELVINSAASGDNIWVTNLDGNSNTSEISYIESPCYDVSSLFLPTIELNAWVNFSLYCNIGSIQASIDGGATWTVDIYTFEATEGWELINVQSPSLASQANVKFRINYESGFLAANGIAIDDFSVKESVLTDAGVVDILDPISSCGLTNDEIVTIVIQNYGAQSLTDVVVDYSIDGGTTWLTTPETVAATIISGGTYLYNFIETCDLSSYDTYEIIVKTIQAGDEDNTNDEFSVFVTSQATIVADDYVESFETGDGGWYTYGDNSTMELAMPVNTLINAAGDGDYAWVTNADGFNNSDEISYLESPCLDFSSFTNPKIKAMINYETTQMISNFSLEYTIDDGASWDTIQAGLASGNWYGGGLIPGTWSGSSAGWIIASTDAPDLAGQASVKLRFVFDTGLLATTDTEGVAVDLINIYDCTDIPTASFTYTIDGTEVIFTNESENATTYEWDFGDNEFLPSTSTEENPTFSYLTDGTYTVSLTATNDCSSITYSTVIDISTSVVENSSYTGIYPNPASTCIYVNVENSDIFSYQIININGQLISSGKSISNGNAIDIKDLSAGVYYIKISTDNKSFVNQLIKE